MEEQNVNIENEVQTSEKNPPYLCIEWFTGYRVYGIIVMIKQEAAVIVYHI